MLARMTVAARPAVPPSRTAFFALLAGTSLGTLSSTIISAPINEIAAAVGTDSRGIVLTMAAFTVAMVTAAPVAGWLADRLGPRRFLLAALVLMIAGHALAGFAQDLTWLVVARAVQGLGCSGIPVGVQQLLAAHWPDRRRQAMAAWASAIGVGQAVGPPTGGVVAEILGWRWVFGVAALCVATVALVILRSLPEARIPAARLDTRALLALSLGAGLLALGLTGLGQVPSWPFALVTLVGVGILARTLRPRRTPPVLGDATGDHVFTAATVCAAAGMAAMGVTMVSVPIYLGTELGLGPGLIGLATLSVAVSMAGFSPFAGHVAGRVGTTRTLAGGLTVLVVAPLLLGAVEHRGDDTRVLLPLVLVLLVIGSGISTVQGMSALLAFGGAARSGSAIGVHNTFRFAGLCLGYAWLAIAGATGGPLLVHAGTAAFAAVALVSLVLAIRGRPARRRPSGTPAPTAR